MPKLTPPWVPYTDLRLVRHRPSRYQGATAANETTTTGLTQNNCGVAHPERCTGAQPYMYACDHHCPLSHAAMPVRFNDAAEMLADATLHKKVDHKAARATASMRGPESACIVPRSEPQITAKSSKDIATK